MDPPLPGAPPDALARHQLWTVMQLCNRGSLSEWPRGSGSLGGC